MKYILLLLAALVGFSLSFSTLSSDFEYSDENPIVYCLREQTNLVEEQIIQFLKDIQDPEKAVALFPVGGKLSNCVRNRRAELANSEKK